MRKAKSWKERHVYFFPCSVCGRLNCRSYYRKHQRVGICRKCLRTMPDPNQGTLFPASKEGASV